MSSQNEVNEERPMVNTQTQITQTPEPQTPQTQTQKHKPRGITAMKSVIRGTLNASKDIIWKDITATCDVDEEDEDYIMKSAGKALQEIRTNCGKCIRDAEGNVNLKPPYQSWDPRLSERFSLSEQNRKRASNPIYPYTALEWAIEEFKKKLQLEQSETPSSAAVDLNVLWVDARKNKQGVVDNEKVQEVVNRVDKYDSLVERFHAMEKRMEADKFVEGPEASTTVKEIFTHPRNHIPIPEEIINNCKLFLDTPYTRAVAIGMVYNTQDAIIHHAQIPSNHLKVSIDISIEDDPLLPILVDEDIITVGLALATFVAWPEHLIDVVPIMGKVSVDDHSATSPPRIDEPASKKAKVVKSTPHSSKSNLESSGRYSTKEFITKNDVTDVHGRDWIGASVYL
ncbi:hypothetical protein Lal_00022927 [Lupinus albus]|nr:hypothetical protein Lal_00022927 [Lupinus albus]